MTFPVRVSLLVAMSLFVAGCSPFMVSVNEVDKTHLVTGSPTKDEIRAAILEGAELAGWQAKDVGNDKILATYTYSKHRIFIEIDYSDSYYATRYRSSMEMKMFCSERDKKKHQGMKVSGRQNCPGNAKPLYIHKAYKQWVDSLNNSIQSALEFI